MWKSFWILWKIKNINTFHYTTVFIFLEVEGELTDDMVLNLAKRICSPMAVNDVAVKGLEMETHVIDACLTNHKDDFNGAMYAILKKWRVGQADNKVAYSALYRALVRVNMSKHIEVLNENYAP